MPDVGHDAPSRPTRAADADAAADSAVAGECVIWGSCGDGAVGVGLAM
jgi:hypothetical protein